MKTLLDTKYRVVTVNQLEAMCAHVSGVRCHTFRVEKVSRSRVHVSYSNEDEYGIECPMVAVFPAYSSDIGTCVVMDYLRVIHGDYQNFEILRDCPPIYNGREYPLTMALRAVRDSLNDAAESTFHLGRLLGSEGIVAKMPAVLIKLWDVLQDAKDLKNAAESAFETRLAEEVK